MRLFKKGDMSTALLTVATFLALGIAGAYWLHHHFTYVTTDDAYVEGRIHTIAAKVPGTVLKVYVEDNQEIKKGSIIVDIDQADYAVKVKDAEAALQAQKARVSEAEAKVSVASANLETQMTALKQAELDAARASKLFAAGAYTREKLEKVETALALAKAQVKSAQEQIMQAKATTKLEVSVIGQREAALENAKLNLSYTRLTAPADGYITKKSVEEGNQIQVGQPLMAIVALDDVWVTANYKETQLKKVSPGQLVVISVDTFPGKEFTGKVQSVMAGTGAAFSLFPPENALGNYVKVVQRVPVKIALDKVSIGDRKLRVGMSVVAKIRIK